MKKKILLVFSAVLLLCLMALPVKAAGATYSTSSGSGYRGDTITITTTLSESAQSASYAVSVTYDKTVLELISGTFSYTSANPMGGYMGSFDLSNGNGASLYSGEISGVVFSATFKIKEDATFGTSNVEIAVAINNVWLSGTAGTVTVNCNHSFTKQEAIEANKVSGATCTQKATYYYTCEHCGEQSSETFESGETLPHTYDKKVETDAYKASKADCKNKAKYYYSCTCGAQGTTTFESGELADHSYTKKDTSADYKKADADCDSAAEYYYSCTGCGLKGSETFFDGKELGHTGGTATCTEKAVCTRCNNPYGETLPHTHDQKKEEDTYLKSEATCTTPKTYYYSCKCGDIGTTTFTVGETVAHSFTKQTESYKYLAVSGSCTTRAKYYYNCEVCGAKGTETFESKYAPSHSYSDDWSSDKDGHWYECLYCTSTISDAKHNPGPAATETTAQTCKDCGYVIQAALGHTHKYESKYSSDANNHWYACSGCSEKKDVKAHKYDDDCDTDCNDCGYTRNVNHEFGSEWKSNGSEHWYECTKCGEKGEVAAHTPGAEATETSPQTCTVCNYELHPILAHTHKFDEWNCNEVKHWQVCSCGETSGEENHEFGEGVVTKEAKEDEEGVMTYTCKDCGYEKTQAIDKLESSGCKKGCKKDLSVLVIGVISLSMIGVLLKKREN